MAKKIIHYSDGTQVACGAEGVDAVVDKQNVNCVKCLAIIDARAVLEGDPIVRAKIFNKSLLDGQDFNFVYERVGYHGISSAIHRIPLSVANHLKALSYPIKAFREGAEEGQSMVAAGMHYRFMVEIIEIMAPEGIPIPSEKPADKKTAALFKVTDKVLAEFEDGEKCPGTVVGITAKGKYKVEFEDYEEEVFVTEELTLNVEGKPNGDANT